MTTKELLGIMAGATEAVNVASGIAAGSYSVSSQKKLMAEQAKYAQQAFERSNARQDWLISNLPTMQRRALEAAGYSSANPDGMPMMSAQSNSMTPPANHAVPLADFGSHQALADYALRVAQAENIQADTEKKKSETKGQDIENKLKSFFGADQWNAAIENMNADTQKKISEAWYNDQKRLNEEKLTRAQIGQIEETLDMAWQKLPVELQLMAANAYQASRAGELSHAKISEVFQNIKKSAQEIEVLKSQGVLNNAEASVALQMAKNAVIEGKIKGYDVTSHKKDAELKQFRTEVETSMGKTFYQAGKIVDAILPLGVVGGIVNKIIK